VQVWDIADVDAPIAVSAGNTENALHTAVLRDVAVLASGKDGITALATPFTNVADLDPPRDSVIATDQDFQIRFNRNVNIEGVSGEPDRLAAESADLLYHLLVLWAARGLSPDAVWAALAERRGRSGLAEKAARKDDS